jgi:hypothetical protein
MMSVILGMPPRPSGTGGAPGVTSGVPWRAVARAWTVMALLLALANSVNVLSYLREVERAGRHVPPWQPITWEGSSAVAILLTAPIVYAALALAPPGAGRWVRCILVQAPATVLFSGLHVFLMAMMRVAVYAAVGSHYRLAWVDFPYEYRKDLVTYLILGGLLWFLGGLARRPDAPTVSVSPSFDIRDGARTIRAPVEEPLVAGQSRAGRRADRGGVGRFRSQPGRGRDRAAVAAFP